MNAKSPYSLLLIVLLIALLLVPSVSAENYIFDLTEENSYQSSGLEIGSFRSIPVSDLNYLTIINSDLLYGNDIVHVFAQTRSGHISNYDDLGASGSTKVSIGDWGRATYGYFKYTSETETRLQIYLTHIEYLSDYPAGLSGITKFVLTPDDDFVFPIMNKGHTSYNKDYDLGISISSDDSTNPYTVGTHFYSFSSKWENTLTIDTQPVSDKITLNRHDLPSQIDILTSTINYENTADSDYNVILHASTQRPYSVIVTSPISGKTYSYNITSAGILHDGQTDPDDQPGLRTGTVTMTDNNGTTIRGFEVTAINAYTGQEYTVSTNTDVAVMTLPMDRTINIRNPQTGEYEEAPIGYYRFYGQAPGYKMLFEDGIQVSVMPEKYTSYELCDIRVTSESGYLTGTHQFQIRSRSDNSILQTGTLSAKSATSGEWFNTTVSGGIATLILPYDTANPISQYAGNYYVYATSPGYEASDYGTQITVMPHTAYEIRDILLTPIGGVPTPGNVTLRIQAFSETGPGVVNAEIFIAGVLGAGSSVWDTYTASSTGYLTVSVPGNSTYDIVASGAGYYDSAQRIEVLTEDPALIEIKLYLSGAPTVEPTTQPTGWPTTQPTTQPTGGIPDEDDDSEGFLMQAVRGIGLAFGVGFSTAKLIFGMLLALSIGYATAKQLRGGAAEFGLGLLGGTLLGVLIGLLPVWIIVVLLLVVGLYIGNRYVGGGGNNG